MLQVTQSEKELLDAVGFVGIREHCLDGTMKVNFAFARWLNMQELVGVLESTIQRQESDQGDWLRAKEWRAAESGLKDKIRVAYMRVFKDDE